MKRFILALILAVVLTLTLATPAFAWGPPDNKPMPEKSIQGLSWACAAMAQNYASLFKINPGLQLPDSSVKEWTNYLLISLGPPPAWGYWQNKP
jgi:hypothetical protein